MIVRPGIMRHWSKFRPSLVLDFISAPNSADSILTNTRASSGTYFDSAGLLQTALSNVTRNDYNPATLVKLGRLIEEARTNLCLRSEAFDNAAWTATAASVSANATTAPDGATTADALIEDSTAASAHQLRQDITATVAASHAQTIFAKANGRTQIALRAANAGATSNYVEAYYTLSGSGSVSGAANGGNGASAAGSIQKCANGWYRCTLTGQPDTSGVAVRFRVGLAVAGSSTYDGDGASGVYLWGAQHEASASFATSYIATTTATVSRAADVCSILTSAFPFNANEGTLIAEYMIPAAVSGKNPGSASFDDGSGNNRIDMIIRGSDRLTFGEVNAGGVAQASMSVTTASLNAVVKSAIAYAANDFAYTCNAGVVQTDTSGTVPTVDRLNLGVQFTSNNWLNGYLRKLAYYPRRLANADLQRLTA